VKGLRPGSPVERELRRLILREGFSLFAGSWDTELGQFSKENFPGVAKMRRLLDAAPKNHWAGFQLYYPMTEEEVRSATGVDLVESMMAVFIEVTPLMNLTMQIALAEAENKV
jgi:hypothetical protein